MTQPPFQLPATVKTFADYYLVKNRPSQIANALGYEYLVQQLSLPCGVVSPATLTFLDDYLRWNMTNVGALSESGRSQTILAPVFLAVARQLDAQLDIDYGVDAGVQLRGVLDYLLVRDVNLLVAEAKRGDILRGMNPLAAQLIALDKITQEKSSTILWGVVTSGESWRFAYLEREGKRIVQDLATFALPN